MAQLTSKTISSLTTLRDEMARVRTQGYATAVSELEDGYNAIGAPVLDHDGRIVAAASVGGPSARLPVERMKALLPHLLEATSGISRRLGYTG